MKAKLSVKKTKSREERGSFMRERRIGEGLPSGLGHVA